MISLCLLDINFFKNLAKQKNCLGTSMMIQSNLQWLKLQPLTRNGMIVDENKHQALVLGDTEYTFSFPIKDSIDIIGMNIDNNL